MKQGEYEELFGVADERGAGIETLERWLSQDHWNFKAKAPYLALPYSQGTCLLCGIDPDESWVCDDGSYKWEPLAGVLEDLGLKGMPAVHDQRELDDQILSSLEMFDALSLEKVVRPKEAIETALEAGLDIPWQKAANNDFRCARLLPARAVTSEDFRRRLRLEASAKGGRQRAANDDKTILLDKVFRDEFEKLKAQGFPDCLAMSSQRSVATKIADKIYHTVANSTEFADRELPELTSVAARVRCWQKDSAK